MNIIKSAALIISCMALSACSSPIKLSESKFDNAELIVADSCGKAIVDKTDYLHIQFTLQSPLNLSGKTLSSESALLGNAYDSESPTLAGYVGYWDSHGQLKGWARGEEDLVLPKGSKIDAFIFPNLSWDTRRYSADGKVYQLASNDYEKISLKLKAIDGMRVSDSSEVFEVDRDKVLAAIKSKEPKAYTLVSDTTCL
ncbi:hypothetical protein ACKC9G_06180 [Pokkaliibacter sp. CJK22405]|uniref:hypothetical protein n=1 Tax=Pokkaliibacter sp. CJK22405 TaxID=3384615 RepID=UPI003984F6D0